MLFHPLPKSSCLIDGTFMSQEAWWPWCWGRGEGGGRRGGGGEAHRAWITRWPLPWEVSGLSPPPAWVPRTCPRRYLGCSEGLPSAPSSPASAPSAPSGLSPSPFPASPFLPGTSGHPPQLGSCRTYTDWHLQRYKAGKGPHFWSLVRVLGWP